MNKLPSYEIRNKLYKILRVTSFLSHPQLKSLNHTRRWKMLLTMRDLRMWIKENAFQSSRMNKNQQELEAIIREINYLQYRGKT